LSIGNLYQRGGYYLPLGDIEKLPQKTDWDKAFVACLEHVRKHGRDEWEHSLRSMYLQTENAEQME
jgi:hypothetical protein